MFPVRSHDGALTPSRQHFVFKWSGKFNAAETYYVYDGEPSAIGRRGNGGVFLLDLLNGTTSTLVPPDNKGQYSILRFYGDSVVYFRDDQIWSIKLDGSENIRLFPPPEK